ncbi:MAG: IS4 family transposase [Ketobacter sp.]|nr:IS4 family transposase [Ketobacter sp.]
MNKQNQIKSTLSQPESIEQIQNYLDRLENTGRSQLAKDLCEHFNFSDPKGNPQVAGCLKALRELEKDGWFILPASQTSNARKPRVPRRLKEPVVPPYSLPEDAGEIQQLELIQVGTEKQMRIWNELMLQDHPQGDRLLVGRQLRYLVKSEHGWLGGVGFSAAALHLEARDRWIGWDLKRRQEGLHYVVNMSRMLIREGVNCRNLASRVIGMAVRRVPGDFAERYGYRPLLLESFVDTAHYLGTSYKAANWQWVGQTKGRGRQDRLMQSPESIKAIYMYPLVDNFRTGLGLTEGAGLGALPLIESVDGENWAEREFGGAPLGDRRLSQRLVEISLNKAENPGSSYDGAAQGDWSKVKAYYRFIEQPDESAVTPSNILLPHREQTIRRMKAERTVLCVQDGSDLNYSRLTDCTGLGEIGTNQTGATSAGLHLHSTLALTEEGLPLGVLQAQCTAPVFHEKQRPKKLIDLPIEEKKTFAWIEGIRDCMTLKAQMPHTRLINVMDREADFFELFDEQRHYCSGVELLVRAKHDRVITGERKLFETIRRSPVQSQIELSVPRQSARAKKSKQSARKKRPARIAKVSLRYRQIEIESGRQHKDKEPVILWVVHVREQKPPQDAERLEWFLLTTTAIASTEDALNCINWYKLRWRIEDWHRVLKSGCSVEKLQHKTAERLKRAVAINTVIAWRIMLMTLLGREHPSLPTEIMFSDVEIKVLDAYAQKKT